MHVPICQLHHDHCTHRHTFVKIPTCDTSGRRMPLLAPPAISEDVRANGLGQASILSINGLFACAALSQDADVSR